VRWLVLGAVAAVVPAFAGAAAPAARGPGEIVFASDRASDHLGQVDVLAPGRAPRVLRATAGGAEALAVSAGGQWIAYRRGRTNSWPLYVARGDGSHARVVPGATAGNTGFPGVFSPDGSRLVVPGTGLPTLVVDTARDVVLARLPRCGAPLAWSANGSLIACTGAHRVLVYDATGRRRFSLAGLKVFGWSRGGVLAASDSAGTTTLLVDEAGRTVRRLAAQPLAWSPDGSLLAVNRETGPRSRPTFRVVLESMTGALPRVVASGLRFGAGWAAFTPDGRALGFEGPSHPELYTLATGKLAPLAGFAGSRGQWSAGGRHYAYLRYGANRLDTVSIVVGDRLGRHPVVVARYPYDDQGDSYLVWSPTRLYYLWSSFSSGDDLWRVDPNGRGLRPLIAGPGDDQNPAFAPDGSRLVFSRAPLAGHPCAGCSSFLWLAGADGSSPAKLTHGAASGVFDGNPSWSPDGKQIAFSHQGFDSSEVDVIGVDGSGQHTLVPNAAGAAWSPDGSTIAVIAPAGIETIAPTGGAAKLLVARSGVNGVAWSPDGRKLAYTWGSYGLSIVNADGSGRHLLTRSVVAPRHPSFSPDGTRITFAGTIPRPHDLNENDVFVIGADGSGLRTVFKAVVPFDAVDPTWRH
jgi:TolB protein